MSDEHEDQAPNTPTEFLSDIAVRLIEGDVLAGRTWRVAYVLGYVLDSAVAQTGDDPDFTDLSQYAEDVVVDIVNLLLYAHVHETPSEEDIDAQAEKFAQMMERTEELRNKKTEPTPEED